MLPPIGLRRYIIFLQTEWKTNTLDLVKTNIAGIFTQAKEADVDTHIAVVGKANRDATHDKKEKKEAELLWYKSTEDLGRVLNLVNGDKDVSKFDSNRVAEDIHGLADRLPVAGFHLDVIWPVTAETVCPIEDNLALFGALQRLKTWHNAHLTLAMVQDGYSWSMDPWLTYLKGEVKQLAKDCGNLLDWDLVWRGDMRFRDGKGVSVVSLPGFNLMKSPEDELPFTVEEEEQVGMSASQESEFYEGIAYKQLTAFDRNLDVIHIVKLEDIPSCLVSSHKFIVKITPGDILPRTSAIYTWLFTEAKDDSMALLVRLSGTNAMASALNATSDGEQLKTEDWKKHMYQVPSVDVKGHPFALHMLLHGDREGRCIARIMHLPHQMNADIHVDLAQSKVVFDNDSETEGLFKSSIPFFDGDKLVEEEEDLDALQQKAIREFVELRLAEDANATVTIDEIRHLMSEVRREYLSEMKTVKPLKPSDVMEEEQFDFNSVLTEFDQSPSEWLERLYLHQKESVEKKMKRYKSSDMMLAGMLVKKCKDNTIQLNAVEFLKHFTCEGHSAAIEEALSPIGDTSGSLSKPKHKKEFDEDTLKKEQPFKDLVKQKYHDIGYCLDLIKAQKEENHLVKMQQKLVWNETASTCTMEQAASPATMEIRSSKGEVKGQRKRKLSDSTKKRTMRGVKRKNEDLESSQANKRRLLRGDAVEETFAKPSTSQRIVKKAHSLDTKTTVGIRSSPRRKQQPSRTASLQDPPRRRVSTTSVSSKVTTTTISAASQRSSRSSSSSSRTGGSRKQKHTEILQGIVDELLKSKDIKKDHPIYPQCSKRLFNTTKEYVRALPPNSYPSLRTEMRNIATQNLDFVVSFEERLHAAKEKK